MKTQALFFPKVNEYEMIEVTLPDPGPRDMVVRTLVSAISPGTERWIMRGKHIGTKFPCIPGYHRIGIVESTGRDMKDFEAGDIVYGTGNRWKEEQLLSMWGAHIGHSVSPSAGYYFLGAGCPAVFDLDTLSFTILGAVAIRGCRFLDIRPREHVLIIGAGIIGICAAQLASSNLAQPVLLDKNPDRVHLARNMGLQAFAPDEKDFEKKLSECATEGFDALYDSAGHAPTTDAMVQKMKSGSRLLLQAQYFDKASCALDLDAIKVREMTVKTTVGIDALDFHQAMEDIRTRRLQIAPLITHRMDAPGDFFKGYELLDKELEFNLGIVFRWS